MPNDDGDGYALIIAPHARPLRRSLPAHVRSAFDKIEADLTDDPDPERPGRLTIAEGVYVQKASKPQLEVTYTVDPERRVVKIIHIVPPALEVAKTLFISYSHEDREWLDKLKKFLAPLAEQDLVSVWDDSKIEPGADWKAEIEEALASAKAALLLISVDFLNSEFISTNELPQLLDAASGGDLKVLWVAVRPAAVDDYPNIVKYKALHREPVLSSLDESRQEEELLKIYGEIKKALKETA